MAITLLISDSDVKSFTSMDGNIDPDLIMPLINAAQDSEIERLIGSALLTKLKTEVENDTLAGDYLILLENYLKPTLAWFTFSYFIPFNAYTYSNKGIFKHSSESSITPEKNEIDYLREKAATQATHYANRMTKWLCAFSSSFPEYQELEEGGKYPDKGSQYAGGINL